MHERMSGGQSRLFEIASTSGALVAPRPVATDASELAGGRVLNGQLHTVLRGAGRRSLCAAVLSVPKTGRSAPSPPEQRPASGPAVTPLPPATPSPRPRLQRPTVTDARRARPGVWLLGRPRAASARDGAAVGGNGGGGEQRSTMRSRSLADGCRELTVAPSSFSCEAANAGR